MHICEMYTRDNSAIIYKLYGMNKYAQESCLNKKNKKPYISSAS